MEIEGGNPVKEAHAGGGGASRSAGKPSFNVWMPAGMREKPIF
jgi:hypothetical protein